MNNSCFHCKFLRIVLYTKQPVNCSSSPEWFTDVSFSNQFVPDLFAGSMGGCFVPCFWMAYILKWNSFEQWQILCVLYRYMYFNIMLDFYVYISPFAFSRTPTMLHVTNNRQDFWRLGLLMGILQYIYYIQHNRHLELVSTASRNKVTKI